MSWRRADNVLFEVVDGRAMLINSAGQELITLNPVGSMVWAALDGRHDAAELAASLVDQMDGVSVATLEHDIASFVAELAALDLVTTD
jgi:hypothetical protein